MHFRGWWIAFLIPAWLCQGTIHAAPVTLSDSSYEDFSPDVEVSPDDEVFVVWERCTLSEGDPVVHHVVIRRVGLNTRTPTPTINALQVVSTSIPSKSAAGTPTPRLHPMVRVDPNWWSENETPVPTYTRNPTKTPTPTPPTWCSWTPTPGPTFTPSPTPTPTQTPQDRLHVTWLNFDDGEDLPPAVLATTHYDYDTNSSDRIDFATGRNASLKHPFSMPIPERDRVTGSGLKVVFIAERNNVNSAEDAFWVNLLHINRDWDYYGHYYWTGQENIIRPDFLEPGRTPIATATPTAGPVAWDRSHPTADHDLQDANDDRLYCAFSVEDTGSDVDGVWVYSFEMHNFGSAMNGGYDEDDADESKRLMYQEWAPLGSRLLYPLGDTDARFPYLRLDSLSGDNIDRVNLLYLDTTQGFIKRICHDWFDESASDWDGATSVDSSNVAEARPAMDIDSKHEIVAVFVKLDSGSEVPYYRTAEWNGESKAYDWAEEGSTEVTSTKYADIQWIDIAAQNSSPGVGHVVWSAKEESGDDYEVYWERITY